MLEKCDIPGEMKTEKLIIFYKGEGKPVTKLSIFKPICLIDTTAKLIERIVMERPRSKILLTGGFSSTQYGFEKGKGTIDIINNVWKEAEEARASRSKGKKQCALVKLDVKNVFNSAPWCSIDETLRSRVISAHMVSTIRSHLSERAILIGLSGSET